VNDPLLTMELLRQPVAGGGNGLGLFLAAPLGQRGLGYEQLPDPFGQLLVLGQRTRYAGAPNVPPTCCCQVTLNVPVMVGCTVQ
jgi:hypothetical protein